MSQERSISRRWAGVFTLIAAVLLSGCTLTPPSSEALIFEEKEHRSDNNSGSPFSPPSGPFQEPQHAPGSWLFSGPLDVFISVTARPAISGELDYAKDKFAPFIQETLQEDSLLTEDNLKIRNPYYLSISSSYTILNRDKVQWAFNVGIPVVGTDLTTNLAPRTYLTANLGYGDGELIVQQKLMQNESMGLALGGYYRAERRGFEIENDEQSLVFLVPLFDALEADRIFYNHILGPRVNGYVDLGTSYLQFRAAPGYAINLKKPILNLSVSIGFNSSR